MIATLAAILGFAGPICDTPQDVIAGSVHEETPDDWASPRDPSADTPTYDCTERQDMGYDSGTPFTITVVTVDGDPVEKETANAFWVMREAAAAEGVDIHINSGFRTMEEQEYFWMCYQCCCCNNCNLAAEPGYSNHQSGHALDLNTSTSGVYGWLAAHGGEYGFTETVPSEDWHWEWWGGGPGGGICDLTSPPGGVVDEATCDSIRGWANDPDDPAAHVEVRVVFDGDLATPEAVSVPVMADDPRDDLCKALGSCDHAFEIDVPLGLRDDAPHMVRVFTVGEDGDSTELGAATSVQCSPPELDGVRRRLPSVEAFDEWNFSTAFDLAATDESDVLALDEGEELGPEPLLVTDAAESEIWLVDLGVRRQIRDADAFAAWHFHLGEPAVLDADEIDELPLGMPLRDRPILATADGERWLIDDPYREGGSGESGASSAGSGNGSDEDTGTDDTATDGDALPSNGGADEGCGCRSHGSGAPWLLLVLSPLAYRRRRSPR